MTMVVEWRVLNKVTYPQDERYSKHVFIVAPGLTVKSGLQVLLSAGPGNYHGNLVGVNPHRPEPTEIIMLCGKGVASSFARPAQNQKYRTKDLARRRVIHC